MNDAEFRILRDWLALSQDWLSGHLGVARRTVTNWESGEYPVPAGVEAEMRALEQTTRENLARIVEQLAGLPEPVLLTFRTDDEFAAHHPELEFTAAWHRMLAARAVEQVPGLRLVYPSTRGGRP